MTAEELTLIAKNSGEQSVVIFATFRAIMHATPNFDHVKFNKEIEACMKNPHVNDLQREMFKVLIQPNFSN